MASQETAITHTIAIHADQVPIMHELYLPSLPFRSIVSASITISTGGNFKRQGLSSPQSLVNLIRVRIVAFFPFAGKKARRIVQSDAWMTRRPIIPVCPLGSIHGCPTGDSHADRVIVLPIAALSTLGDRAVLILTIWLLVSLAVAYRLTSRGRPRFDEPVPPSAWGRVEDHRIKTSDGEEIGAWFVDSRDDTPSVLCFTGTMEAGGIA